MVIAMMVHVIVSLAGQDQNALFLGALTTVLDKGGAIMVFADALLDSLVPTVP